jgi:uncharacterized protein (TIGR02231 family)
LRGLEARSTLRTEERAALGDLLGRSEAYARGLAYGRVEPDAQMALFQQIRERAEALDEALLDIAAQRREMERRREKLQRELDRLRDERGRERYAAAVELEVSAAGELALELTYVVTKAGWKPLYDLRLGEDEGGAPGLDVDYLAQVRQRTGEDWDAVAVTLSTARPALAQSPPELDPWYVGPLRAPAAAPKSKARMMRAAPEMADAAFTGAAPEAEFDRERADVATARVDDSGLSLAYRVEAPVTVPADGEPHKVAVARFALAPEIDYASAPKLVEAAYRRARGANDSPYTLLPGRASLFAADEFIGTTKLPLIPPQGELELYLGVDDGIEIERELVRREVDKRLIGDRRRLRYGYRITVRNTTSAPVTLSLHDQLPVARHEEIKVRLDAAEPKPAEQSELNLLEWRLALDAGQERAVRFDFVVEHPRDMTLVGLP